MRSLLVAAVVLAAIATAVGLDVVRANGYLRWDDAQYLYRGIYHARQVEKHSDLFLPRLVYSLSLETPKPPLFTGWIALGARLFDYLEIPKLLFWSTAPIFFALLVLIFVAATRLAGLAAGWLSVVCALSFPSVPVFGGNLMVESMLSIWILAAIFFAVLWCEGPTWVLSVLVGTSIGLALLAKLTAAVFLAPALLYAGLLLVRRRGWAGAMKSIGAVSLSAIAVCGFWYFRNFSEAVQFARYAYRLPGFAGRIPFPTRVLQAFDTAFGWWWLALLPLLLVGAARKHELSQTRSRETHFRRMAFLAAGFGFVVVCASPFFDARYFLPVAPVLAVVSGAAVASALRNRRAVVVVAALALLSSSLALSARRYRARKCAPAIGGLTLLLEELHGQMRGTFRLGLLGNDAVFNLYRVELANILRPTYSDIVFVPLDDRDEAWDGDLFRDVDAVLAVARCPDSPDDAITYVNRNCRMLRASLEAKVFANRRRTEVAPDSSGQLEVFDLRGRRSAGRAKVLKLD